jgi:hypothetical protein
VDSAGNPARESFGCGLNGICVQRAYPGTIEAEFVNDVLIRYTVRAQ